MGLNRPNKYNAVTLELFHALAHAYGELERDHELRVGVLFAHGHTLPPALTCSSGARVCKRPIPALAEGAIDPSDSMTPNASPNRL